MKSCLVTSGRAQLYCETAGSGVPLIMIHAAVADSRQWNREFAAFSADHRVVRYDMRGCGQSDPVEGSYRPLDDLLAVLDVLEINEPAILMGCSMGGSLAMDMALEHPDRVKALIMVSSGPAGLELDAPESPKFAEALKAFEDRDLDLAAEIETQIWFDGEGRTPQQVDPDMRQLLKQMDRIALGHDAKGLGKRLHNTDRPAAERLEELNVPILVIYGENDEAYTRLAAEHMERLVPGLKKVAIPDAAHLPNMDHPEEFERIVRDFLEALPS